MKLLCRSGESIDVDQRALVHTFADLRAVLVVDLNIEDVASAVDLPQTYPHRDLLADRRRREMFHVYSIADGLLTGVDVTPHQGDAGRFDELDHRRRRIHRRDVRSEMRDAHLRRGND